MHSPAASVDMAEQVLRAQIAALFANNMRSVVADSLLAWGVCGFFYWRTGSLACFLWIALHALFTARNWRVRAYFTDPHAAQRSRYWGRLYARELLLQNIVWGLAPWLMASRGDLSMHMVVMLIVLGLASTGVPAVAHYWRAVVSFVVPMVSMLAAFLLTRGDATHIFMAACCLIHIAVTLLFAREQHNMLASALITRFEKEALAEQLEKQIAVVRRASEEKTRFLASASHDMRQPMHAIAMFGATLEQRLQQKNYSEAHYASQMMGAVRAMATSLDTMLDISRLDAGVIDTQHMPVDLQSLFVELHGNYLPNAQDKNLQLRFRATTLCIYSDPALLRRLLGNLIDNAIKYTVAGGVLVAARVRGNVVWLDVIDTGVGIAPDQQMRIFEEFYQVDNPGRDRSRGLGIGLSIVQRLAQLLDHPVSVHSHLGKGSRFRVQLPVLSASLAAASVQAQGSSAMPAPAQLPLPQRILLLDDESAICQAIEALLGLHGLQVTAVQTEQAAAQALACAAASHTPYQALICDLRLAEGADGLAAARRLQTQSATPLPLLIITGETAPEKLHHVRQSQVAVLYKPVCAEALLSALGRLQADQAVPHGQQNA